MNQCNKSLKQLIKGITETHKLLPWFFLFFFGISKAISWEINKTDSSSKAKKVDTLKDWDPQFRNILEHSVAFFCNFVTFPMNYTMRRHICKENSPFPIPHYGICSNWSYGICSSSSFHSSFHNLEISLAMLGREKFLFKFPWQVTSFVLTWLQETIIKC